MELLKKCDTCTGQRTEMFLKNVTTWEHKGVFNLVRCKKCQLVFVNPRPSIKQMQKYYPKADYWGWEFKGDLKVLRNRDYKPIYNIIFNRITKGEILDIGTGSGYFLTEFKERQWKVQGTDLSRHAAKLAFQKYGIETKTGDFNSLDFNKQRFDVVTLNNVLEHVHSPYKTLNKVNKVLRRGGLLVVTVPNIDSFGFRIFKSNWHALQPPRHLFHFSKSTLDRLFKATGFESEGYFYNYKVHIVYSLFESFRFALSPKFKHAEGGGKAVSGYKWKSSPKILVKNLGLIIDYVFTYVIYFLEILFRKTEVITVYAIKK